MISKSRNELLLLISVFLIILAKLSNPLADPDLWGYLNFGRVFWQNGFPWSDTFSYLPTKPEWIYHEWLTGVI
ncbi:MAG: hypothetical protein SGJ02_05700, partial [bacterium]|nr:hypothetical protein [bacterium]